MKRKTDFIRSHRVAAEDDCDILPNDAGNKISEINAKRCTFLVERETFRFPFSKDFDFPASLTKFKKE